MSARIIMVVDPAETILEMFDAVLSAEGYEVHVSTFEDEPLVQIAALEPDVLIVDYFPNSHNTGLQLLEHLYEINSIAHIPTIVCTTTSRLKHDVEAYFTQRGIHVVQKPFTIDDLLEAIESVMV